MKPEQAWRAALEQLQMEMPKATFDTWVRDTDFVSFEDGVFVIGAANEYARQWLEGRLSSTATRLLTGLMNQSVEVRFIVSQPDMSEEEGSHAEQGVSQTAEEDKNLKIQLVHASLRDEFVHPNRVIVIPGYFQRWLPYLGPTLAWIVVAFRQAMFMATHREARTDVDFEISPASVARWAGISRTTLWRKLDDWIQRLFAAGKFPRLQQRLNLAKAQRWAGAIPTWEPVDLVRTSNAEPVDVTGIDGSQVYPQERNPVLWTYIQAVAYSKLVAPIFESQFVDIGSELTHPSSLAGELVENRDGLTALTNTWRTLLETRLARVASERYPDGLVLLDNGLPPWLSVSSQSAQRHLQNYMDDLGAIRPGLVAGIISGPQSCLLSRLIALVEVETVEQGVDEKYGLLDIVLMRYALNTGERSALFLHGSPRNDVFLSLSAGVYFFFLRVNEQEIERVEIPDWVANEPTLVDVVHTSILADACMTSYSYVLSQAHHHVIVPADIARIVQARALTCYWQAIGCITSQPAKIRMKRA